ncbi:hypothetical protein KKF81_01050 [Candidatus Micrarchaeota archaeon]|nr:hypothetical protein [Candidatus Micrarchaeota archaeon]MBU1165507.1 hypothetical protein [Candidatus Micrarchaeota archaeon]MBU1886345.1 hypothetical protein [Candidatus Micrarchaeota archaeon]
MEKNRLNEILQYLIEITAELQIEVANFMTKSNFDYLGEETGLGADGEPTTKIDKFAEEFIIKKMFNKFSCRITSEETGTKRYGTSKSDLSFIIDPIDGTKNAVRKIPFFSCSIAVLINGIVVVGVVRDLYNGDLFYAIRGNGSFYNNKKTPIKFNFKDDDMPVIFSRSISDSDFRRFKKMALITSDYRIFGCPSIEICYVAAKKFRAAIQIHEKPNATMMDLAAAQLILHEAGGRLVDEKMDEIKIVEDPAKRVNFIAMLNEDKKLKSEIENCLA